jgi:hypothetical protein
MYLVVNTTKSCLSCSGFPESLYKLLLYSGRDYLEIFFQNDNAIDYLVEDIELNGYSEWLEIRKYDYAHRNKSTAIVKPTSELKRKEAFAIH